MLIVLSRSQASWRFCLATTPCFPKSAPSWDPLLLRAQAILSTPPLPRPQHRLRQTMGSFHSLQTPFASGRPDITTAPNTYLRLMLVSEMSSSSCTRYSPVKSMTAQRNTLSGFSKHVWDGMVTASSCETAAKNNSRLSVLTKLQSPA
jgi:hypothetical protein